MTQDFDPRVLKLLKSTQAAFPLGRDPWGDLAHGLAATRDQIAGWIEDLHRRGICRGVWAEPNVHHPTICESLVFAQPDDSVQDRWRAGAPDGTLVSRWNWRRDTFSGWRAERWFKMGVMIDLRATHEEIDPFAPSTDRTVMPESPAEWPKLETGVEQELASLSSPIVLSPADDFWSSLGANSGLADPRAAIQRVVLGRLARRFAMRLSPTALGWDGCGLACWSIGAKEVDRAAGALSAISCTGDVAIRNSTSEWPFNLSALILGRGTEPGEKIAAEISRRWGRDLGRWIAFQSMG